MSVMFRFQWVKWTLIVVFVRQRKHDVKPCVTITATCIKDPPLQWRHNQSDGVSNHQRLDCLLNRSFRRRSKKTSKLRVTGLCQGNPPVTDGFPSQRASNAKMFPSDDVIMSQKTYSVSRDICTPFVVLCFVLHYWPLCEFPSHVYSFCQGYSAIIVAIVQLSPCQWSNPIWYG